MNTFFSDLPGQESTQAEFAANMLNVGGESITGWQPIETAPKDGTEVVLYNGKVGNGAFVEVTYGICEEDGDEKAFSFCNDWSGLDHYFTPPCAPQPTHWMPLPTPPPATPPKREP